MKIKYYLRGLGTGIIFTAIVLMIIYSYRTTDSKTINRARELGMIMPGETSKQTLTGNDKETGNGQAGEKTSETDANREEFTTEPLTAEPATTETVTEEPATEPVTEEPTTEPPATEPATEEPTTRNQPATGREITFTISNGMYSEAVSQRLQELGVIDDAARFNQYLVQNGQAGRIRTGIYTLTNGMSYADVAAIIAN